MASAVEEAEVEFNYVIIEYLHGSHHPLHSTPLSFNWGGCDGWMDGRVERSRARSRFFDEPNDELLADGEVPRNMSFYGSLLEINLYTWSAGGGVGEGAKTGWR